MGMGDAGVAMGSGANGAQINPASLTHSRKQEFSFSYQDILDDSSLGFLGFVKPLNSRGISELGGATLFTNAVYVSKGTIEINRLNTDGSLASTESRSAGYDLAASFGYAEHFFRGSFGLPMVEDGLHSLGMTVRMIQSTLAPSYSAQAVAADLGYLSDFRSFALGLSVANLGSKLKFIEQGDPLPVAFRAGLSANKDMGFVKLTGAFDVLNQENTTRQRLGFEIGLPSGIALRTGWRFEPVSFQGGPSAGFGLDMDNYFVDYAFNWFGDLRDTHRLLFGLRFGSTLR